MTCAVKRYMYIYIYNLEYIYIKPYLYILYNCWLFTIYIYKYIYISVCHVQYISCFAACRICKCFEKPGVLCSTACALQHPLCFAAPRVLCSAPCALQGQMTCALKGINYVYLNAHLEYVENSKLYKYIYLNHTIYIKYNHIPTVEKVYK